MLAQQWQHLPNVAHTGFHQGPTPQLDQGPGLTATVRTLFCCGSLLQIACAQWLAARAACCSAQPALSEIPSWTDAFHPVQLSDYACLLTSWVQPVCCQCRCLCTSLSSCIRALVMLPGFHHPDLLSTFDPSKATVVCGVDQVAAVTLCWLWKSAGCLPRLLHCCV